MLRRAQSIKIVDEPEEAAMPAAAAPAPAPAAEPAPRPSVVDRRQSERRQAERRGMDTLRAEALRNVISMVEDRNFNGLRNRTRWGGRSGWLSPSRIMLLVVALGAGGLAAYLATQREAPPAAPVQQVAVEPLPATQVLIAKQAIGVGERLTPEALGWTDWPDGSLRPEYITKAGSPGAMADMAGSVARSEILAGEPIRQEKLAPAGAGFLAAILSKGMRAVSVSVNADAASGGFVVPNDHVDVVLTRNSDANQSSETILTDVRVLAINDRLGPTHPDGSAASDAPADPAGQKFSNTAIATLELDPTQAEVIINAATLGRLSLMLRATADDKGTGASASERAANAAIRMSSPFWTK